jgi:predicted nucleic acid-binding Zn ribbon protein
VRRLAPRPLSAALDRLTPSLSPPSTLARVQGVWPEVAGQALSAEAEPVSEHAGTLTFQCRSAVWAQELDLLSTDLLERLNEAVQGSSLTRLRFISGGRRAEV